MKKITSFDFSQNQSVRAKRWCRLLTFCFVLFAAQIGFAQFTFPTISGPITVTGGTDVVQNLNNAGNSASVTAVDYEAFTVTVDWTNVDNAYSSEARLIVTTSSGATALLFPTSGASSSTDPATITFTADFDVIYNPSTNGLLDMTIRQSWGGSQANWSNIQVTLVPVPDCIAPVGLTATNITTSSATLGWTSNGTMFDIEYGISGFTPTGNPNNVNTTGVSAPFLLGGLAANTDYEFYVRQDCGSEDGDSFWTGPLGFRTLCNAFSAPTAIENFNGYTGFAPATLNCWSEASGNFVDGISGTTSLWTNQNYNNDFANVNGNSAYINLYNFNNEWLISPAIDLGDGTTPYRLEYDVSVTPWLGNANVVDMGEKFVKVVISTDGGLTWLEANVIKTYDNANIPNNGGISEMISLEGYTGIVKFAFYASSTTTTTDLRFFIDNWRVNIVPTCEAPTALSATNISATGATLGWTSTGNNFDLEWGQVGFEQGGAGATLVSDLATNSYALTVTEGGTYQFYVRQDCGDTDGNSQWAGPFNFYVPMVGEDCSAPIVVATLPYTTTDDTANYYDNPTIEGAPGTGCGSIEEYLNGNDVVYAYTADFDGLILVGLAPTANYAGIFAYASCTDIGTNCIAGAVSGFGTNQIGFELAVNNGSTYYFVISTWAFPQTTGYTLEISKLLCSAPTALTATNITSDSAVLAWTSEGTLFDVEFGATGFAPTGNPSNASTTGVANAFALQGLTANTAYQYYVRQDCGNEDGTSEWVGPFSFKTDCEALAIPTAVQNFTSFTGNAADSLDCWKEATGNFVDGFSGATSLWTNQNYNNNFAHPNSNAAFINLYGINNEWLISPAVDLGDGTIPARLEFNASIIPWVGTANVTDMGEKFVKVVVSTDEGSTWSETNTIRTYDNANIPNNGGISEIISLEGYTGLIKVAFYAYSTTTTTDFRFYIDNWRVNMVPECDAPTALTATNISLAGATLGWTSTGNNFDVEWGQVGFEQGGDDATLVSDLTTNSYNLTVTQGGAYQFYVRQDCGGSNGISEWAGPFNFNIPLTGEDCSAPIVIAALPYTTTDDTANYGDNPNIEGTPGASGCGSTFNYLDGNDVVYSYTSDFDGFITVSMDPTANYAGIFAYASCADIGTNCIAGAVEAFSSNEIGFELAVTNGSTYYFVISTWASPQTTGYTLEISKLLCSAPSALTATNITDESAQLAWTSDGTLFDIEFGETGFTPTGNPTNANTTGVASPFTLEDLTSDTAYQYYVRQDCGTDGTSDWSGPFTFRTECVALTVPTAVQDFSTYTGTAPASLDCWKEATGNFVNGLTGTTSTWTNQNYNNDATHPNGTAAYVNLYGTDNEWLISPPIDLGAGSADYQLKYDVSIKPWSGTDPVTNMEEKFVKVVVSTDGGSTWSEAFVLQTYDNNNIPADGGITETISLANFTGVIKVAFYAFSTTFTPDLRFFIDNFSVEVNDPCAGIDAPTGEAFQTLSEGQTLADLVVNGENLTWYSDDNLQYEIPSTTVVENNTTYFVTQSDGECTSEALAVTVQVTLSTGDFNLVSLKAYPNPTNDFVTVSYNNDITNVAVINMLGQTLMTKDVNANTTQIDMTSLPSGNYFVKVNVEGAVKTIKIVKN